MRLLLLLSLSLLIPLSAHSATLKIATLAPDGTTWMKEMRRGAEEIRQKTNGRVKLKFYPGGVMGNAQSVLRKIRIRQLQGGAFITGELSQIYPEMRLYGLPFLFDSYDEVDFVRSRIDNKLVAGLEEAGMIALGISEGGFVYVMSNEAQRSFNDLKQKKVWLPEGDKIAKKIFDQAGINPIPLPVSDVYTGLQTGLVDTVANTPMGAIAFQWHTRISHITDAPLAYASGTMALDKKAFNRLSPADRTTVRQVMNNVFKRMNQQNREDNKEAYAALEKQGVTKVMLNRDELQKWKSTAASALNTLTKEPILSSGLLKEVKALQVEYKKNKGASP